MEDGHLTGHGDLFAFFTALDSGSHTFHKCYVAAGKVWRNTIQDYHHYHVLVARLKVASPVVQLHCRHRLPMSTESPSIVSTKHSP